jgi:pyruvate dehydrogenase kinase 2/3/4
MTLKVDMEELKKLASMRCTPLSLKDMYKYAVDVSNSEQRLRNAQFLHKELPIRIAQRAVDLLTLPHGLSDSLPIRQIAHVYLLYLEKFQEFPVPTTPQEEDDFTEMLTSLVLDRSSIPNAIAKGVDEWLQIRPESTGGVLDDGSRIQQMEDALYRFFTARTGLRFLTEHHILSSPSRRERCTSLRRSQSSFLDEEDVDMDFLGCIHTDCDPSKEVRKVASKIKRQTEDYYGLCPEIQVIDSTRKSDSKFTYVPHHLHYMAGELIKNSCRATVRR